ncbi:MAG: hypothetical protein QOH27_2103 [Mycobacterium sp.]|jgi:hypothetical protein|nr:hypothetical protein [Mycobacterium sp.]MDT7756205.1 hypothetical protein [Mycobacterium sp.]
MARPMPRFAPDLYRMRGNLVLRQHAAQWQGEHKSLNSYCITQAARYSDTANRRRNARGVQMDPSPDYDASDEIEYFFQFVPWGLRGVYPPPAYPPV